MHFDTVHPCGNDGAFVCANECPLDAGLVSFRFPEKGMRGPRAALVPADVGVACVVAQDATVGGRDEWPLMIKRQAGRRGVKLEDGQGEREK
jgi:hypothetical protein